MSPNLYANTPGGGFPTNTNQAGGGFLYNNLVGGGYRNPWGGFNQYGLGQVQPPLPQPVYGPINPVAVQQAGDGSEDAGTPARKKEKKKRKKKKKGIA